jgi:deoxyribodipyrimidine photo-lyase
MYVAMLMGNILKVNPLHASKWFYYHLLDADIASNTLNWEWIISKKKYYANQENINRFCYTQQQGTFLDTTYEALPNLELGNEFTDQTDIFLHTELPPTDDGIDPSSENIFIYNNYHLDETWHHNQSGIRVLLLEPSHFSQYPVSPKSLEFIMSQSRCIPGIKIYTGSFASLQKRFAGGKLFFKEHPLNSHYVGQLEQRDRLFQDIQDYEPSFSSFWKKCLKYL